jgi:hypothetical protein
MRASRFVGACLAGLLCLVLPEPVSAGGVAELFAASNGEFGTINQSTGVFTQRGTTPTDSLMPALACNAQQALFGSENREPTPPMASVDGGSRCGFLAGLDQSDGTVTQSFGFITLAGSPNSCLRISDFDFNPANGVLYGVGRANSSRDGLFTISLTTPPVATLVGLLDPSCTEGCLERGGLAFRDDGALFVASVGGEIARLNPADASVIGSILPMTNCIEGMSFRSSDDVLFATECDSDELYTIDETTGQQTLLNASPGEGIRSLAFCGDRGGIVGGATPTPTVPAATATPTRTSTPTSTPPQTEPVAVPTMSGLAMTIFGLLLAAGAVLSILRVRS